MYEIAIYENRWSYADIEAGECSTPAYGETYEFYDLESVISFMDSHGPYEPSCSHISANDSPYSFFVSDYGHTEFSTGNRIERTYHFNVGFSFDDIRKLMTELMEAGLIRVQIE